MLAESRVIEGPYLADLLEQPDALRRACEQLEDIAELRECAVDRIVLTGMGSSHFALYPLYLRLIASGRPAHLVETAELIHYQADLLSGSPLLIAVSQSGRSAEMVSLMERCGASVKVVAVTNDDSSPLAARADYLFLLAAGPESTVSCKTYVATMLVLDWLAAVMVGDDLGHKHQELQHASGTVSRYLNSWRDHVDEWLATTRGIERIFLAGRGPSLATAQTGGLILKESTRFAAEGMSCAAFRHGPLEAVRPRVLVLICEGDSKTAVLNRKLVLDVEAAGGRAVLLGPSSAHRAARWSELPSALTVIMEMLPVQMLSLALAASLGIEAGRFERATKITAIE